MATTLIQWAGHGLDAAIPNAATLHGDLPAVDATARYYAYDTGIDYVLDRDAVAWVQVGGAGAAGINELTGDVTAGPGTGAQAATIANDAVTTAKIIDSAVENAKLADMASMTFKANLTGGAAAPQDAAIADVGLELAPYIAAALGTGDVTGPGSSVIGNIAVFSDEYGTEIADSGIAAADVLVDADIGTDVAPAPSGSADTPLFDDGSGGFTNGTRSGDTTEVVTSTGAKTAGNGAVWDADGNLVDSGSPPGSGGGFTAVTKTTDYSVLSGDSGTDFNNDAAGADVVLSLPAAVPDLLYGAAVHDAFYIKFEADGTDQIAIGTDNSAAGGYVRSNLPFSYIELRCHVAGQWVASSMVGSWGIDV